MTEIEDVELRRRFASLRAAEHARVPGFAETIARAKRRRSGARPSRVVVLATATASMAALVLCFGHERRAVVPIESISTWRPATDALLPVPSSVLFGPMPPLGASVVDSLLR